MKYKTDAFVFSPENNFIKPISTSKDDLQFFLSSCYAFLLRQLGNKKTFFKDPVHYYQIRPDQFWLNPIGSNQIKSKQTQSYLVKLNQFRLNQIIYTAFTWPCAGVDVNISIVSLTGVFRAGLLKTGDRSISWFPGYSKPVLNSQVWQTINTWISLYNNNG